MSTEDITNPTIQRQKPALRLPGWLGRRRLWVIAGFAAVGAGLALNWSWLSAVGTAPILISILPCAAMCALGLCMRGGTNASCSTSTQGDVKPPERDGSRP